MIETGIYSKSSIKFKLQEIKDDQFAQEEVAVNKSIIFHLINSYIHSIFINQQYQPLQKIQILSEYGELLGFNLAEEECYGFVKYCSGKSQKNDNKQFVGEMKLLNSRIWTTLIGSKAKLFAVSLQTTLINSYKVEDKEFKLGKSVCGQGENQYKKLLIQFCRGLVFGVLNKFGINGQISCGELPDNGIYVELKNLNKKENESNPIEKMKSNFF